MIQTRHVRLWQLVFLFQSRPTIPAVHELVAEAEPQFRMRLQIGDRRDAEFPGAFIQHPNRVGVVEPQRLAHRDTGLRQRVAHGRFVRGRFPAKISCPIVPVYSG